ncbi:MAG: hypothetical protein NVSMB22_00660 [Chloroflexota bacterium]
MIQPLTYVRAAQCGADGFAHCNDGIVIRRYRIIANVDLNPIRDRYASPRGGGIVGGRCGNRDTRNEGGCQRLCDTPFQRIARHISQLPFDDIESLTLPLTDLDRKKLQQMTIAIRRCRAGTLWAIQETVCNIKSYSPCTWRCSGRRIRGSQAGGIDKGGDVTGQPPSIPRRLTRMRAK